MPEFFSSDGPLPLQFLVIFGVIVVLLMAAYLLFRRIAGRGLSLSARAGNRGRQPRLGIVDIYELDRQRQLILLRRDNVEHLLLVGGPNDVVVERNVQRGAGSRLPPETVMRPEPAPDLPAAAQGPMPSFPAPSFEMPVVIPPPLPGSTQAPEPQAPRLDPALFEPDAARPEPTAAPFRTNRFLRRTPPPLVNPRPDAVSERVQAAEPTPAPQPEAGNAPPEPEVVPPVMAVQEPRNVDPAVLSDMARQLEVALRRPSSAVTPPPGQAPRPAPPPEPPAASREPPPAPPEPEPEPTPQRPPDPMAARMAASQAQSPPDAPPLPEPAAPEPPPPVEPVPVEPPPVPQEASAPESRPEPPPPARPERKPEPQQPVNPFSVEEIEAEFARLLGRPLDKKG